VQASGLSADHVLKKSIAVVKSEEGSARKRAGAASLLVEVRKECSNIVLRKAIGVSHISSKEGVESGVVARHYPGRVYSVSFHRIEGEKMDIALDAVMSYAWSLKPRDQSRRRVPVNAW